MSGAGGSAEPMSGVEGGGDVVVAQYPVYLVRNADPGGALYLLQSPLRPATRPYALEECDEVRFKVCALCCPLARSQPRAGLATCGATTLSGGC
jgi:hypothetical protein